MKFVATFFLPSNEQNKNVWKAKTFFTIFFKFKRNEKEQKKKLKAVKNKPIKLAGDNLCPTTLSSLFMV